jgi:RNA polymerase sigma-70 factor (ECF subfamily)
MILVDINSSEFISRLKSNDDKAFSDLVSAMLPKVCGFLVRIFSISEADAEELAADIMLKVNNSLATYKPTSSAKLSTWILQIARNTAIDFLRQQSSIAARAETIGAPDGLFDSVAGSTENSLFFSNPLTRDSCKLAQMEKALGSLKESDREILVLKQCFDYEDIAELENISIPTLRTRYFRALERLRSAYDALN